LGIRFDGDRVFGTPRQKLLRSRNDLLVARSDY
jgi:hypothetical protein